MKIVFLNTAAQGGGAEAALLDLFGALRAARPEWSLHLITGETGPLLDRARALGVTSEALVFPPAVHALGEGMKTARRSRVARLAALAAGGLDAARYLWLLRARLRELAPDVLHSNTMKMHLLAALAKPRAVPLVWHLHDYLGSRPTMRRLLLPLAGRCQQVVANSESVAADARQLLPAALPVCAVHNAIDLERFRPDGPALDLDALAGLPPAASGTVRVGLVATFAYWKGHEVLLRAAAKLLAERGNGAASLAPVRFYIVGGPIYSTAGSQYTLPELRTLADSLGLAGQVGFTGFVEDAPAAMRALDVVVHASTQPEPFGLVIAQGMACKRAVVVSAGGGAREIVEPEVDALIHPPGDADALARAVGRLADDPALRARLAEAGCAKAGKMFTRERMAARMAPIYETLGRTKGG